MSRVHLAAQPLPRFHLSAWTAFFPHYNGKQYKYDLDTSVLESTPTISAWKVLHNNPEALERQGGERAEEREG